jgi:hypothetical protein
MTINGNCPFTNVPSEILHQNDFYWVRNDSFNYAVEERIYEGFRYNPPSALLAANVISEIIKVNEQKLRVIWNESRSIPYEPPSIKKAVFKYLEDFRSDFPRHSEKPDSLLSRFAAKERILGPFQSLSFDYKDMFSCKILTKDELKGWIFQLIEEQLLEASKTSIFDPFSHNIKITAKGWRHVEKILKSFRSNKSFIAMSFSLTDRDRVQDAMERACRENGFEGQTVDREEFNGAITDKIIAMINSAHFVISDFTENKHGVYYEAGYAAGLGKTVIYTVNKDHIANLHFDTRHLNHVVWDNYDDLFEKLNYRIKATFKIN